jgi:hypothetical protein
MGNAHPVKVFLSSTYTDLAQIRSQVSSWLSGVFGAQMLIMETFGSDAEPPKKNSLEKVRECDLFVGIYAHRYGTVDPETDKSITELELDEARNSYSSGITKDILLYLIDENAPWPDEFKEKDDAALSGLKRLKDKAKIHTCTSFIDSNALLISVVRDIYAKLVEHFHNLAPRIRASQIPRQKKKLSHPFGMEFLTSADEDYLVGRSRKIDSLMKEVDKNPIVLLLGDSGIGKTSLIHAGLIPAATRFGWRPIYTRPFGNPSSDIAQQILTSVYEGRASYRGPLVPLLAEITTALAREQILLIIDQFEDIFVARDSREAERLITALSSLYNVSLPSLRVLVSYRADLEGRLGEIWQKISGSPSGLSRVYLGGVSANDMWEGITKTTRALSINLNLGTDEITSIKSDLAVSSQAFGFDAVYPPYIQMLVDHVWSCSQLTGNRYTFNDYQSAGKMSGIVGGYLTRQLRYAQDTLGHIRLILISLVRSYGVKAQKSFDEILADTGLTSQESETALEKLIDLRLVRHVEKYYEITHDFIAKKISSELIDTEEREFKRIRELLNSKSATYDTTKALLAQEELLMLYKHRERLVLTDSEVHLVLTSWLEAVGPALYWLMNVDRQKLLTYLSSTETPDEFVESQTSAILLRKTITKDPFTDSDFHAFRSYQFSSEMAALITANSTNISNNTLLLGLRHRREEVREACLAAVSARSKQGDWNWVELLRDSSSKSCRAAYEGLVSRHDVGSPPADLVTNRALREFSILKRLSFPESMHQIKELLKSLRRFRPAKRVKLLAKTLSYKSTGHLDRILKSIDRVSSSDAEILLSAISEELTKKDFGMLLSTYEHWNAIELGRYEAASIHLKARALASAVHRCASEKHLPLLRRTIKRIRLTPSSREVVLSLFRFGSLQDYLVVLRRIAAEKSRIDYWNHTELGKILGNRLQSIGPKIPKSLLKVFNAKEFWGFSADQGTLRSIDRLPIKSPENRQLFTRLVAYGIIGCAGVEEKDLLVTLSFHAYELIARSAAVRLVKLLGRKALKELCKQIDYCIAEGKSRSLASAIRYAEIELYGLLRF